MIDCAALFLAPIRKNEVKRSNTLTNISDKPNMLKNMVHAPKIKEAWNEIVTQALEHSVERHTDAAVLQPVLTSPEGFDAVDAFVRTDKLAFMLLDYIKRGDTTALKTVKKYLLHNDTNLITRTLPILGTKGHLNSLEVQYIKHSILGDFTDASPTKINREYSHDPQTNTYTVKVSPGQSRFTVELAKNVLIDIELKDGDIQTTLWGEWQTGSWTFPATNKFSSFSLGTGEVFSYNNGVITSNVSDAKIRIQIQD